MTRWIAARLSRKLIVALILGLGLVSALFFALLIALYTQTLRAREERAAHQLNQFFQATLENAMLKRDIPGLQTIVARLAAQDEVDRVMIVNPDLVVRFSSDPARLDTGLDVPELRRALETRSPQAAFTGSAELRAVNPVQNQPVCGECHGPASEKPINGLLVVDFDAHRIRADALRGAVSMAALGALAMTAASAALWLSLRRTVLTPIARLTTASRALAEGALGTEVPVTGQDEIAALGTGFNRMSRDLAATLGRVQRSEAELQALIDAMPDGVRVIGDDYRVLRANRAYAAQVSLPMSEILGGLCYAQTHGRSEPCPHTMQTCPVMALRAGGEAITFRDEHVAMTGRLSVEVSAGRITLPEQGAVTLEAIRDMDRAAQVSHEARLSEIGLLAAGVAHEIHNPLSSVALALTAIGRELDAGRGEAARRYFETIRDEVRKCLEITDNLLLLSTPAAGHALISLAQSVRGVTSLLRYEAETRGITVILEIGDDLRLHASDSDLRMLVTNLTMNAFHAMPKGGTVRLAARREAGKVVLEVADTGTGIAPEDLSRIFLPFWSRRADASEGRGLGLAIVRSILERHGASVAVASTLGKGTTFTLRFPDPDADRQEPS